jgi:hypothetical protein
MINSAKLKQAGHFELLSFKVTNFERTKTIDINRLIHAFNIDESMSAGSVRGSAIVYDALNILAEFPLIGEETLEITYTDFYNNQRQEIYFLYAITDVGNDDESTGKIQKYKINFVSPGKFYSENFNIMKAYKPDSISSKISDYVKLVYDEYYKTPMKELQLKTKELVIEDTQGVQSYVIPNYTPEQTMHFFSRRAISPSSTTQFFRFFESREKYYFATNEYMDKISKNFVGVGDGLIDPRLARDTKIKTGTIPIFRLNYMPDVGADKQIMAMSEIIDIEYGDRVNSVEDITVGAYKKKTTEIDIMNGAVVQYEYDHITEFKHPGQKLIHTQAFIDRHISAEDETFVVKDYHSTGATTGSSIRNNQYYPTLYNYKRANLYHYRRNQIAVTINGRNNIFAGSMIDLEINAIKTNTVDLDKEKSGRYIVESISSVFFENTFRQKLVLSRSGIGI